MNDFVIKRLKVELESKKDDIKELKEHEFFKNLTKKEQSLLNKYLAISYEIMALEDIIDNSLTNKEIEEL